MGDFQQGKKNEKESVGDDLESLFRDLQLGSEPNNYVKTYFLPMLTKKDVKLLEKEDSNYMYSYLFGLSDVSDIEISDSESDSRFLEARGLRRTLKIENPLF